MNGIKENSCSITIQDCVKLVVWIFCLFLLYFLGYHFSSTCEQYSWTVVLSQKK